MSSRATIKDPKQSLIADAGTLGGRPWCRTLSAACSLRNVNGQHGRVRFKEITFGYKSAEAERRANPALLDSGFFQSDGVVDSLLCSPRFIVLGYKGSGKSSIAEHLDIAADQDPYMFVEIALLKDFPFDDIPNLVPGDSNESVRTSLAWSILLLIRLIESLMQDEGARDVDGQLGVVIDHLRSLGLLKRRKFKDLVLRTKEIDLALELPKFLKGTVKLAPEHAVNTLTTVRDSLREAVSQVETESRHVLVLDGLDEVFDGFERYYPTIAALVHEADALNTFFDSTDSCTKVVLLCRTDIFERLPSPNINKLRDYAVHLNWYESDKPYASKLFRLASHRAGLAGYEGSNVIKDYLPQRLDRGTAGDIQTASFLLDHTRHTPRDFLQLLFHVQLATPSTRARPTSADVLDGLKLYSTEYFLPEIKDELSGYLSPDEVSDCLRILGGVRAREFSLSDLIGYAKRSGIGDKASIEESLRVLFDCSAVGNIVYRPRGSGHTSTYFTFRFRNRNSAVNFDEKFLLHRGLWKSFNLM